MTPIHDRAALAAAAGSSRVDYLLKPGFTYGGKGIPFLLLSPGDYQPRVWPAGRRKVQPVARKRWGLSIDGAATPSGFEPPSSAEVGGSFLSEGRL